MNNPIIKELFTEWVNANQDRIRFAAWLKTLTAQDIENFKKEFASEDALAATNLNQK